MGLDPVPTFTPPYESAQSSPELAARFPLSLISSPAHQFLNSSFVNVDALRRVAREPELLIHPDDAAPRGVLNGTRVEVRNDRGSFSALARVSDAVSEGTIWAPSVWWTKFAKDGRNA